MLTKMGGADAEKHEESEHPAEISAKSQQADTGRLERSGCSPAAGQVVHPRVRASARPGSLGSSERTPSPVLFPPPLTLLLLPSGIPFGGRSRPSNV